MSVGMEKQIACVVRELALRKRAYPLWVQGKRMKQEKADEEIAAMEAVLLTVKRYGWLRSKHLPALRAGPGAEAIADIPDGELLDAFIDAAMMEASDGTQVPAPE